MKGDNNMAKLGEYINNGEFELVDDGWHLYELKTTEVVEQEDKQSGKMKKKLKCCFETVEIVNSEGNPFKVFFRPNLEVNPTSEKSGLYALLTGLYGKVPDNVADIDIEEDLCGKRTWLLTTNDTKQNGKTYTEIVKFSINKPVKKPTAAPNQEKAVKALALTKMHEAFKQYGLSPEVALETCSNTVGREIKNTQELSLAEIKNISDFINTLINEKKGENPCDTKDDPDFVAALQP